ncbi:MAG TPA: hypothetical protein VGK19_09690 [Capsulimonadaceae bacterium]|jgi:hypothetical protein
MKTTVSFWFRNYEKGEMPTVPEHLGFLAKPIQKLYAPPRYQYCGLLTVGVKADSIDDIIDWARTEVGGESIIRTLIIDDYYDFAEISNPEVVEVLFSDKDLDTDYDEGSVYDYISDCTTCARKKKIQLADCGLKPKPKSDIISTSRDTIIVSDAARDVLARFDVQFRPIKKRPDFWQVCTGPGYELDPLVYPTNASLMCPECNRYQVLLRIDLLEGEQGGGDRTPKLSIKREQPLTIKRRGAGWDAVACETPRMGRYTKDKNLPSDPEPVYVATKEQLIGGGSRPVFLRADVAAALDAAGIKGLMYLPVHISG